MNMVSGDPNSGAAQQSLFGAQGNNSAERQEEAQSQLSSNQKLPLGAGTLADSGQPSQDSASKVVQESVWGKRLGLVTFVLITVELGLALIVIPWLPVWKHNALLAGHDYLRALVLHNFTRGIVSGFGLIDIWIGILAAVHYREGQ
jgi:hypothetical protein